jgi:hypothetical protein
MKRFVMFVILAGITLPGCTGLPAPDIKFVDHGVRYSSKPDFARVEHEHPLAAADLAMLTPETLKRYDQEQIDQIYARLTAGIMPDGLFDGSPFLPKGNSGDEDLAGIIGGLKGIASAPKTRTLELLANHLWHKKVFHADSGLARTRIDDPVPFEHLISGDPAILSRTAVGGKEEWLMFPARLYCGQSLLDSRRESIIIDYSYADDIPGYRKFPDYLTGRWGMEVRDEIRMVRPGFYLGRAYLSKIFFRNFTLYKEDLAKRELPMFLKRNKIRQDCWPGEQNHPVAAAPVQER